jgi:large subunit ribosomal protein L4
MVARLGQLGVGNNVLLVTESFDASVYLAARNIPGVEVCDVAGLDPVSLVQFPKVVITSAALERVGEWLG